MLLKSGGKGTFVIPSSIAYGDQARGPIEANSVLVFEVELLSKK
jgi:FKBP-type peptidyl-prolyl cis-trans isomerase